MVPLVLLPGMNCTADLWAGCDLGDDVSVAPLVEETVTAQVDRLLDELPARFTLGGLSLGGIVAMALAIRAPERVAGLCVLSTNAKAPTDAQRAGWADWLARLDAGESARDLQEAILPALLSTHGMSRPDVVDRVLRQGEETGADRLRAQLRLQGTREDLRAGLRTVAVPALVISPASDVICPPDFHAEIAAALPEATLQSLPGGHLLPMEQPELFGDVVRAWRAGGL